MSYSSYLSTRTSAQNSDYTSKSGNDIKANDFIMNFRAANNEDLRKELTLRYISQTTMDTNGFYSILNAVLELTNPSSQLNLLEFAISELEKHPGTLKNILDTKTMANIIDNVDQIEVLAILFAKYKKTQFSYTTEVEKLLVAKITSPKYQLMRYCHCEIIPEFLNFKEQNPAQILTIRDFDAVHIERCIRIIHDKLLVEIISRIDFNVVINILTSWLMIFSPALKKDDYTFVKTICQSAMAVCKTYGNYFDSAKLKDLFIATFKFLKYRYYPNETLQGYKNFLILYDMIDRRDISSLILQNFAEIIKEMNFEVEAFIQIFTNLIRVGVTSSNCLIIMEISRQYEENKAYEPLNEIFHRVVCEYIIQKIHVERGFRDIMQITSLYFLGFLPVYEIKQDQLNKFLKSLQFLSRLVKRDNKKRVNDLLEYVDFLDTILDFYGQTAIARVASFTNLKEMVQGVRKEFSIERDAKFMKEIIAKNRSYAWNISPQDIKAPAYVSAIETLMNRYKLNLGHKGLRNLGNTCYMNSAMISLFVTPKFREKILKLSPRDLEQSIELKQSSDNSNAADNMIVEEKPLKKLFELFIALATSKDESINPISFRESLPVRYKNSNREEDASEFFRDYLDLIEKPLLRTMEKDLLDECFSGDIVNTTECNKCQKPQRTREKFLDLPVNLNKKGVDPKTKKYDLKLLIKNVFDEEIFDEQNKYYCDNCKAYSDRATKTSQFTKMPEYLIITLNRFNFDIGENQRSKICDPVTIYNTLNFETILDHKSRQNSGDYDLYAIIIHSGLSAEHGHYFVFSKENPNDKFWLLFNDSIVLSIPNEDFDSLLESYSNDTPYMLFYKRRDVGIRRRV